MKLTLNLYKFDYTVETPANDLTADELREIFDRLLVQAGYPADIRMEDGWKYKLIKPEEEND